MSLPLSHIHRTHSEIKFTEDTRTAEWRDYQMYCRLANGIAQNGVKHYGCFMPSTFGTLSKIEQVHNTDIDELDGSTSQDDDDYSSWDDPDSSEAEHMGDVFAMDM